MKKVLFFYGTRPEAIKMAPVIKELKNRNTFEVRVCISGQHREMVDVLNKFFEIEPDYDLNIMKPRQTLFDVTELCLSRIEEVLEEFKPDILLVQGDTTSAFAGALAAFYKKIHIGHIEAGLRTYKKYSPFPEEKNRVMIGHLADFHFAPTEESKSNLLKEGIVNNVFQVGNTVIDALLLSHKKIIGEYNRDFLRKYSFLDANKKTILVTAHRRENWGEPLKRISLALKFLIENNDDIQLLFPVHPNPLVREIVQEQLGSLERIYLVDPMDYPELVWAMNASYLVLTDSGGIQEEAPSLGKPVLVLREDSERMEGVRAGNAKLVGSDKDKIVRECELLLRDKTVYNKMSQTANPYGDGTTSQKIADILLQHLSKAV